MHETEGGPQGQTDSAQLISKAKVAIIPEPLQPQGRHPISTEELQSITAAITYATKTKKTITQNQVQK